MPLTAAYKPELPPCPPEEYAPHWIVDIATRKPIAFTCWRCGEVFDKKTADPLSHSLRCPARLQEFARDVAEKDIATFQKRLQAAAEIRRMMNGIVGRCTIESAERRLAWLREHGPDDPTDSESWTFHLLYIWALERKVAGLSIAPTDKELLAEKP